MEPITVAMLASAAVSAGTGIYQSARAKKMAKANPRPVYEVPEEMKAALSDAERLALEGLPAEQKQQYIENIQRANQSALRASSDRKGGLAGIGAMHQNELDQYRNLLAMDSQARTANQRNLQSVRQDMASIRDKEFRLNKYNPFLQAQQDARNLQAAGMDNLMQGVQQGIYGLGAAAQGAKEAKTLKSKLATYSPESITIDPMQYSPLINDTTSLGQVGEEVNLKLGSDMLGSSNPLWR